MVPADHPIRANEFDQSAALDAERAADRGFGGAGIERCRYRRKFLRVDGGGPTAMASATPCRSKSSLDSFLNQGPFELRKRAKNVEQELALRRGGIHLLGQRTKGDAAVLESGHCGEEMRQRSAKSVQLPNDQAVAGLDESQRFGQAGPITAAPGDPILK